MVIHTTATNNTENDVNQDLNGTDDCISATEPVGPVKLRTSRRLNDKRQNVSDEQVCGQAVVDNGNSNGAVGDSDQGE